MISSDLGAEKQKAKPLPLPLPKSNLAGWGDDLQMRKAMRGRHSTGGSFLAAYLQLGETAEGSTSPSTKRTLINLGVKLLKRMSLRFRQAVFESEL